MLLLAGVFLLACCYKKNKDDKYNTGIIIFTEKNGDNIKKSVNIEIADDNAKRTQGLMWRHLMPEDAGMFFIFEKEKPLSFYMKNTYIPLDIIYVNKSMEIIKIQENTTPLSEISILSEKPAQYVIEVNAGFCRNYKINTGDKIQFKVN